MSTEARAWYYPCMPTILAIDPGYDRCGVAIVADKQLLHSTCIQTKKSDSHEKRLAQIFETLQSLIAQWHPTHIAVETLFFSVNKTSAIKVAEARGVVILLGGVSNIPIIELSPQDVKLIITGIGNADKKQVQKMVALTLAIDLQGKIDDEVDAIAIGFAATEKLRVENFEKK